MRTIKQAGFDIKPTTQKLIAIELLKSYFGHDKYDKVLRQKLSPFGPLTMKYASLQYTVKVDTKLKDMLETHYEQDFDFLNKLFKDKAKINFWFYTLPIQVVGFCIHPIMAYNGDWNYLWLSLITYFLFGCIGMAIGLHRYWGQKHLICPNGKKEL